MKPIEKDVVIIGAGAAGLTAGIEAGRRGRSVLILEHNDQVGRKVRVSGGGRCNFTNLGIRPEHYISRNPHFCKSALARYSPADFISRLERHGIRYHEKESGQLFCNGSSEQIVRMLVSECGDAGAEIRLKCRVAGVEKRGRFIVRTDTGAFASSSLLIATGGLSYPALGASDLGFRMARQFGIAVTPLKPALVPLSFRRPDTAMLSPLSGVSIHAELSCGPVKFQGPVLFTHHGLSGPAALQISSYWNQGDEIAINLLPGRDAYALFTEHHGSRMELQNFLSRFFPKRFSSLWCSRFVPSKPLSLYSHRDLKAISQKLHNWTIRPADTEGYGKAEVTRGGIDTAELSSKTMEAKKVAGLFFAGEVVDVTGQLGGYNLHWAWASGYTAGQYV